MEIARESIVGWIRVLAECQRPAGLTALGDENDDQFERLQLALIEFHLSQAHLEGRIVPNAGWDPWRHAAEFTAHRTSAQLAFDHAWSQRLDSRSESVEALAAAAKFAHSAAVAMRQLYDSTKTRDGHVLVPDRERGPRRRAGPRLPWESPDDLGGMALHLRALSVALENPIPATTIARLASDFPLIQENLSRLGDQLWSELEDRVQWSWYQHAVRADGWKDAAEIAVEFSSRRSRRDPDQAHAAMKSAVTFARQAVSALIELENTLRSREPSIELPADEQRESTAS